MPSLIRSHGDAGNKPVLCVRDCASNDFCFDRARSDATMHKDDTMVEPPTRFNGALTNTARAIYVYFLRRIFSVEAPRRAVAGEGKISFAFTAPSGFH